MTWNGEPTLTRSQLEGAAETFMDIIGCCCSGGSMMWGNAGDADSFTVICSAQLVNSIVAHFYTQTNPVRKLNLFWEKIGGGKCEIKLDFNFSQALHERVKTEHPITVHSVLMQIHSGLFSTTIIDLFICLFYRHARTLLNRMLSFCCNSVKSHTHSQAYKLQSYISKPRKIRQKWHPKFNTVISVPI